jgi:hypothetical protein
MGGIFVARRLWDKNTNVGRSTPSFSFISVYRLRSEPPTKEWLAVVWPYGRAHAVWVLGFTPARESPQQARHQEKFSIPSGAQCAIIIHVNIGESFEVYVASLAIDLTVRRSC